MRDENFRPATLRDLAVDDQCNGVFCWCNRCSHNDVLPLASLIPQLGPDYPVTAVLGRLRCQACGSKDIAARPSWRSLGVVARHQPMRKREAEPSPDGDDQLRPVPDTADSFETGRV